MSRPTRLVARALVPALALAAVALPTAAHASTAAPSGPGCDRLDDAACLLPFPNDAFRKDGRVAFTTSEMPRNVTGKAIDPAGWKGLDGFSPGSVILTKVPGLDTDAALEKTGAVSLSDIGKYTKKSAPVLVVDETTGKRWPIWAELDDNAKLGSRLLEVHPAKNFLEGHTYVVVLRALKKANGGAIAAGKRFAALRDGRAKQSSRYNKIFKAIKKSGVRRDRSLFLTWDFTVGTERALAGRALSMRDQAFAQLGDTDLADGVVQGRAPLYTLQPANYSADAGLAADARSYAQVVEGTVQVPCFMTANCAPGSHMVLNAAGTPVQQSIYSARFTCVVPATATAANPARLALYGHGLLGKETEIVTGPDVAKMAAESNTVFCATPWIGMAGEDIPNAINVLGDFSNMPTLADRLQQGFVDALVLGRLMANPSGIATNPLLQQNGAPIVRTGSIGYDSNSQGGIAGGALTALAPDFSHAVLGVPGINYSVLLPRSADFDTYSRVMYPKYPDQVERPLVLDLAQLLWDRGEGDGYAQHMTTDPLPGTIKHTVLLDVGVGDHQVSQFQADVEARTIGASIHAPSVPAGRSPQAEPSWGIPAIRSYPFTGSAIVYWDAGPALVNVPPLQNHPSTGKQDPHELVRRTPAARAQKATFLAGGGLVDPCGAGPCLAASDVG
jgi:hypothetical protein